MFTRVYPDEHMYNIAVSLKYFRSVFRNTLGSQNSKLAKDISTY
jgi:hypothetical protein